MYTITPLPSNIGYGFTTTEKLDWLSKLEVEYKQEGIYHNYYYKVGSEPTWPIALKSSHGIIDAFSPNLNKSLHVGHLRNLCIAFSLYCCDLPIYSLYGTTLGVLPSAKKEIFELEKFLSFYPTHLYDITLKDPDIEFKDGVGTQEGTKTYNGIVVIKSDGFPTYSYYELAFAKQHKPSFYITGSEQVDHFKALGLQDKHLPMGLVLGSDGKKLKSRDGNAMLLKDLLTSIEESITGIHKKKIAWNIAAINMLLKNRSTNIKFSLENWVNPINPGMYITYTAARIESALKDSRVKEIPQWTEKYLPQHALASYFNYYYNRTVTEKDPVYLAQYALELSKELGTLYHKEQIKNGEPEFVFAVEVLLESLKKCMSRLGLFAVPTH